MNTRRGKTLITIWEDPEVKALLTETAKKEGKSLSSVSRRLLRNWLRKRNIRIPTEAKINKEGASNA